MGTATNIKTKERLDEKTWRNKKDESNQNREKLTDKRKIKMEAIMRKRQTQIKEKNKI